MRLIIKKYRKKHSKKLLAYIAGIIVVATIIIFLALNQKPLPQLTNQYTNSEYHFRLALPEKINRETKTISNGIREYFYIDGKELFRLHIHEEISKPQVKSEYFVKYEQLGNNQYEVELYPKGLDSGEFALTAPILYYHTYHLNTEYSFQFNDQTRLSPIQKQILSSLKFE